MVGLPWQTVSAFLRIMTNQRLPGECFTVEQAAGIVDLWLAHPIVQVLTPGDEHWRLLRRMVVEGRASGPLVSDAEIATLTVEYGGVVHTAGRGLARFPGPRLGQPLGVGWLNS